jgi:hypothetical protein
MYGDSLTITTALREQVNRRNTAASQHYAAANCLIISEAYLPGREICGIDLMSPAILAPQYTIE